MPPDDCSVICIESRVRKRSQCKCVQNLMQTLFTELLNHWNILEVHYDWSLVDNKGFNADTVTTCRHRVARISHFEWETWSVDNPCWKYPDNDWCSALWAPRDRASDILRGLLGNPMQSRVYARSYVVRTSIFESITRQNDVWEMSQEYKSDPFNIPD